MALVPFQSFFPRQFFSNPFSGAFLLSQTLMADRTPRERVRLVIRAGEYVGEAKASDPSVPDGHGALRFFSGAIFEGTFAGGERAQPTILVC